MPVNIKKNVDGIVLHCPPPPDTNPGCAQSRRYQRLMSHCIKLSLHLLSSHAHPSNLIPPPSVSSNFLLKLACSSHPSSFLFNNIPYNYHPEYPSPFHLFESHPTRFLLISSQSLLSHLIRIIPIVSNFLLQLGFSTLPFFLSFH